MRNIYASGANTLEDFLTSYVQCVEDIFFTIGSRNQLLGCQRRERNRAFKFEIFVLFLFPTVKKIVYILLERMLIFPSVLCTNCTLGKIMHFSPSIYNILRGDQEGLSLLVTMKFG
jgi:hypothetical protein